MIAFDEAGPDDVPVLVRLVNAAYRDPGGVPGWTDERGLVGGARTDAASLRAGLRTGRMLLLRAAAASGAILACLRIEPHPPDGWTLGTIAVDPGCQNSGLGRALLAEAERRARAAGIRRLRLTVIPLRAELVAWYERRGFRRSGAVLPFPYGDPAVGRPLRPDLTLAEMEKPLSF